ncbi:MAG: hypothetical protein NC182_07520 [Prevotella sp.]|nr:hypothetical protein [Staphylococcus sp.]MCM1351032.1 hypothetical protein [Prevotella sp.]
MFNDKMQLLNIEYTMYIFFIIASLIDIDANVKTRKLYLYRDSPDERLRQQYIVANILILIVFIVFLLRNYEKLIQLSKENPEYKNAWLRYIGSVSIVSGQLLVLYYFYHTTNFKS